MKKIKFLFAFLLVLAGAALLAGCDGGEKETKKVIKIGNTASKTGAYNSIGLPFGEAIQAVVKYYNDGKLGDGLVQDHKIEYIWKDDKSSGTEGPIQTQALIEDDKILAFVGHFGTWTIEPTVEDLRAQKVPMIHAATGTNALLTKSRDKEPGNYVMPIQPIYYTEGQALMARVMTLPIFGAGKNEQLAADKTKTIVVAHSNAADGTSIKAGVDALVDDLNLTTKYNIHFVEFSDTNASANAGVIQGHNPDALIVASNQKFFQALIGELNKLNVNVPIFTSYVNADASHIDQNNITNLGDLFFNGWYDMSGSEANQADLALWRQIVDHMWPNDKAKADSIYNSTHSKSGLVAITTFIEGLRRMDKSGYKLDVSKVQEFRDKLVAALEEGPVKLPLAGSVDFSGGLRVGTQDFMLWVYNRETQKLEVKKGLENAGALIESIR